MVSRAGMGALTELSVLGKPTIVIPISGSHQEDNAYYFKKQNAVVLWDERQLNVGKFFRGNSRFDRGQSSVGRFESEYARSYAVRRGREDG